MKYALLAGAAALAVINPAAFAQTPSIDPALRDVIIVTASRTNTETTDVASPEDQPAQGHDVTHLLSRVPGGARVGNGALSGQAQYRGLFGERLNLRVDGQRFASGGPNLMDPAFHYAPAPLVAAMMIDRGVSPVSEGPGLAGGMDAVFKRIDFSGGPATTFGYDVSADARTVDDSTSIGGIVGASTERWRLNLLGSYEKGDDTRFPGGTIAASSFERGVYGASGGLRFGDHTFTLDLRRQNTGPSGNPPFPMDMIYFDTDFARAGYSAHWGETKLKASVGYVDVAHLMDNLTLRPTPITAQQRAAFAVATTRSADASLSFPALGGELSIGLDGDDIDRDVAITNPTNSAFFIRSLPDIAQRRLGGFAEWTGGFGPFESELGLRVDSHNAEAGLAATGAAVPAGPTNLANAFNASDRSYEDTTWDAVARLWTPADQGLSWRFTLARKTRAPGHVERFLWLPNNTSGGLADGNIYVGDLNIKPETAWIGEAGFDYRTRGAYLRPTVYIRQVDDYIQGVPFDSTPGVLNTPQELVASMNGDSTPLRFANVDARLYGFDLDAGLVLGGPWRVDAVASYVRGERRDIDDNLYRIAPPSLIVGLTYEQPEWSATVETRAVSRQDNVSATNSEVETAGYVLVNVFGDWAIRDGVRLSAGIENLLDHKYEEHLSGYNRIDGSDVPLGSRLPGAGRGIFVRLGVAG